MVMDLTLIGGPFDGRTIHVSDAMASAAWLDTASAFPMRPDETPVFYRHRYSMRTGIHHGGKMPIDRPAIPRSITLFGPRMERWLERIDRWRPG